MTTPDSIFQRALSNMLTELFDGPPGQEAYVLNPGDPGLLRQLDSIDASAASKRPMPGKTTIAAHIDHVHLGLSILNRWAAGEANPWAGADGNASWQRTTVTEDQWQTLRDALRHEADKWRRAVATRTSWDDMGAAAALSTLFTQPITSGQSGKSSRSCSRAGEREALGRRSFSSTAAGEWKWKYGRRPQNRVRRAARRSSVS